MPTFRTRLSVGLVSLGVIALELGLMRGLALRFWAHFAYMVIAVALLGFASAGTMLTLLRRRITPHLRAWTCAMGLAFALSVPLSVLIAHTVPLDVHFLAWDLRQLVNVLVLELVMLVPFFFAGSFVGLVLMDAPGRVSGHYAANLVGSGIGAILAVVLMYVLSTGQLLLAAALISYLGTAVLIPWGRVVWSGAAIAAAMTLAVLCWWGDYEPPLSRYKRLWYELAAGGEVIQQRHGPLGRIDVVEGPAVHHHPGVSWEYTGKIPEHVLLIVDRDHTSAVYDCKTRMDWEFLDYTTSGGAYALRPVSRLCVVGAGGGADIGLGVYHNAISITALEMNSQIVELMIGALADRGGRIYRAPQVEIVEQGARGFFNSTDQTFDVIQVPPVEPFGASGAGLHATQESYLYTVESFAEMLDHLSERGILCVTQWMRDPPRGALRAFDIAAQALARKDLQPSQHLIMIRSRTTVTILASMAPLTVEDANVIRTFCERRGFDLCCLPGLAESEVNRYHVLPRAYHYEGARALLGPRREQFLREYLFSVSAPTDDRPYFSRYFRLAKLPVFLDQLGRRARTYLERSYLMLLGALVQTMVLGGVLIVLPLVPGLRSLRGVAHRFPTFAYFFLLGIGFMFLEMGMLQKLILYLAHPIYSAAAVIASFLVFAGVGSRLSEFWKQTDRRIVAAAGSVVVVVGLGYVFVLDGWLGLTQGTPLAVRFVISAVTIAPLAIAMGHMFPTALRSLGCVAPQLVPWGWAVNGLASVLATVATPLVAMHVGFTGVTLIAVVCYAMAATFTPPGSGSSRI